MELFNLGHITATPGAFAALQECGLIPIPFLARHACGDFGVVDEEDRGRNLEAIRGHQGRILSAYDLPNGQRIWIITNLVAAGQNDTCLLLPTEY